MDEQELLTQAVQALSSLSRAKYGAIALVADDDITHFVTYGMSEVMLNQIGTLPSGKGLLAITPDKRSSIRIDDISLTAESVGFPQGHPQMKTLLVAPIYTQDSFFGQVYLSDKDNDKTFNEVDEQLVNNFASSLALAIDNMPQRDAKEKPFCLESHPLR